MRSITGSALLFVWLALAACGDAGVGFNVSKKVPINFHIFVAGNDPNVELNPPAFTETFRLADVGSFEDVLSNLAAEDGVIINGITYSISEVSIGEEVALDEISLSVASSSAQQINVLAITGRLQNTAETNAGVNDQDTEIIKNILTNFREVDNTMTFDFAEVPPTDLEFVFTLYYDVTLRVRL